MSSSPKIKVVRLAHVHYQHPQLDKAVQFLKDFGLFEVKRVASRVYFAGFGVDPYIYIAEQAPGSRRGFLGGAWVVHSESDLQVAAAYPGASGIWDDEGPGGGKIVSITDPNGYRISFVYGQEPRSDPAIDETDRIVGSEPPILNLALEKPRQGAFRRFNVGPSPVHKLGHYGYIVPQTVFQKTFDWYTSLINVVPTDAVFDPKTGDDATCFMHIDLGAAYSDHHSFFLGSNPTEKPAFVHHSSFEVNDMDTQALGHKWLSEKGYTNCWGIGRHVLGSQIFDYWFDTSGNILEHYSDGDVVNKDTPYTRSPEAPDSLYIWGPNLPLGFVTGNPTMRIRKPDLRQSQWRYERSGSGEFVDLISSKQFNAERKTKLLRYSERYNNSCQLDRHEGFYRGLIGDQEGLLKSTVNIKKVSSLFFMSTHFHTILYKYC